MTTDEQLQLDTLQAALYRAYGAMIGAVDCDDCWKRDCYPDSGEECRSALRKAAEEAREACGELTTGARELVLQ